MLLTLWIKKKFGHADVNSMYASCEQVCNPKLRGKPLYILSNNDGIPIAKSKEAKELLDLDYSQPWFKFKDIASKLGIIALSSNYEMYADFSNRFVETLRTFTPSLEVYSIDECFLDMTGFNRNLNDYGQVIKDTVKQWTGLPICVGFGHSKTLAKLANHIAKKQPQFNGVCDLTEMTEAEVDSLMDKISVGKIWGVGKAREQRLNQLGVHTVLRLKRADCKRIRDEFGVVLERTVKELNGEPWLDIEDTFEDSKQLMSSRSFGQRVSTLQELEEVISFHVSNASQRLRKQNLYANAIMVFIQNSPFDKALPYTPSHTIGLPSPTNNTLQLNNAALWSLKKIFKEGIYYQKAGVMLTDLVPYAGQQLDIFGFSNGNERSQALMETMDKINLKFPDNNIKLASEGIKKSWIMRRELKSPNYTTDWNDLPVTVPPRVF